MKSSVIILKATFRIVLKEIKTEKTPINEIGIKAKYKELEKPLFTEGFDKIFNVKIVNNTFEISSYEI